MAPINPNTPLALNPQITNYKLAKRVLKLKSPQNLKNPNFQNQTIDFTTQSRDTRLRQHSTPQPKPRTRTSNVTSNTIRFELKTGRVSV